MKNRFAADWNDMAGKAHYNARELALLCHLSPRHMQRLFQRDFALSPQRWLDGKRIAAAAALLLSGKQIKAVAFELGFKQPSHFCRQFKTLHRMTPSEYVSGRRRPECRS